jgi:hypothetical protein
MSRSWSSGTRSVFSNVNSMHGVDLQIERSWRRSAACSLPVLYVAQEMGLRLGAVTGVGHARLKMDGVDHEVLRRAEEVATDAPGVLAVDIRGRWTGRSLRLEVESRVKPTMTVAAFHALALQVRSRVLSSVEVARVVDVSAQPSDEPRLRPNDRSNSESCGVRILESPIELGHRMFLPVVG